MMKEITTGQRINLGKIKKLHDRVFHRNISEKYLRWIFDNPYDSMSFGLWDGDQLIGFYCGEQRRFNGYKTAIMTMAMIDPEYRKQGLFVNLAETAYDTLWSSGIPFIYLFANKDIVDIYRKYLGFIPIRLKKYWYSINGKRTVILKNDFIRIYESQDKFKNYRYFNHPEKKYSMYLDKKDMNNVIFNVYANQLQLVHFYSLTPHIIDLAIMKAGVNGCEYITCFNSYKPSEQWFEEKLDTWFCYKQLDSDVPSQKLKLFSKLRMGMSDVY